MKLGLIICAGKQTRFNENTPKALVNIDGETLLDKNIKNMKEICDDYYIVVSNENKDFFKEYSNVIVIESGLGCGDAVHKALYNLLVSNFTRFMSYDACIIQWGDSFIDLDSLKYAYSLYNTLEEDEVIIPCRYEKNPYVQIIPNGDGVRIHFSKFNEKVTDGYHDLSFFIGNTYDIYDACKVFRMIYSYRNGYIHKHNNEFSFLDLFNDTSLKGKIVEIKDAISYSFNTLEELNKIKNEVVG